jgi:hypothetical protein
MVEAPRDHLVAKSRRMTHRATERAMTVRSNATTVVMLTALAAIARPAGAQQVTGVVRDSASREPVPSAVVRLFDPSGRELERTITGRDGRYRLDALSGGRQLRVVRIGFRPRTIPLPATGRDTTLDVVLVGLPTLLEAVNVDDQPQCSRRSDRAAALALWEQARAALLATVVARESRPPMIEAITYDRTVDRRGRVVRQKVHHDSLPTSRPFIAGRRVGDFRDDGYADGVASQRTYYGPDADALLDPAFGDGHCFSVRQDKDKHAGQIGLAFEPVRDRDGIIDIAGIMWLDVATPSLRTIEFRYTNVERPIAGAETGGFVSFRTATNGLSVIDRWNLHLPSIEHIVATQRRVEGPGGRVGGSALPTRGDGRDLWRVLDVHDVGAVIARAVWPDGSEWRSPLGTLRGRAVRPDSASGVSGVLVWLMGSDDSTRAAADGSFELPQLLPGLYPVFAAESPADRSLFQQNDSLSITIDSAAAPPLRLVVPTLAARIKAYCKQGVVSGPGTTLLLGNVLLPDGSNASGAAIQAFWGESVLDVGRGFRERARTDTSGTFHVCGLIADDTVLIKGVLDSLDAFGEARFRSRHDSLLAHVTLRLTVPPFRARTMRVVDERGDPIRSASLLDDETGEVRATTNFAGEASLGWLPRGRTSIPVQRLGYQPTRVTVNVTPNDTTTVSVLMRPAP